eukprot:scaffold30067_cov141-Isochrysis_galbana.AAC.2
MEAEDGMLRPFERVRDQSGEVEPEYDRIDAASGRAEEVERPNQISEQGGELEGHDQLDGRVPCLARNHGVRKRQHGRTRSRTHGPRETGAPRPPKVGGPQP